MISIIKKTLMAKFILILLFINNLAFAIEKLPQLFLFLSGDNAAIHKNQLQQACVTGVQIVYRWKQLEPHR